MGGGGEAELEALIRAGALDQAATLALERYGPELYGFLVNLMGDSRSCSSRAKP